MARTTATNFTGGLQFPYATAATDLFKKEDVQVVAQALDQHDHSSGKGLALAAGAIGTGIITSAMIADGTIATADLAANSVTQAGFSQGLTANPTTTSTSPVDLDGNGTGNVLRVDLTTKGGDLLCWLEGNFSIAVLGGVVYLYLSLDGAAEVATQYIQEYVAGYAFQITTHWRFTGVSAGAHYVKARWAVNGNTGTALQTYRQLLVLERIK